MTHRRVSLAGFSLIFILSGCPGSGTGSGTTLMGAAACERPAQRCKIKDSVLGVCMREPNGSEKFQCIPQH